MSCAVASVWMWMVSGFVPVQAVVPDVPDAEVFRTEEYRNSTGLDVINAAQAYAKGYTGKGVWLGLLDDGGVNLAHREFAAKDSLWYVEPDYEVDWVRRSHGSHVAGIMAASRDGALLPGNMHGVAFDASLMSLGHMFGMGTDGKHIPFLLEKFKANPDVKILNNSWGNRLWPVQDGFVLDNGQWVFDPEKLRPLEAFMTWSWDRLDPVSLYEADKLIVFLAGNSGKRSSQMPAVLPSFVPGMTNWINVLALDTNGVSKDADGRKVLDARAMAVFSNLALGSEEYSIVAPGMAINSVNSADRNGYMAASGTSMAAPYVSGALGLVQQAYPWMSAKQLADTVLTTADRDFTVPEFVVLMEDRETTTDDGVPKKRAVIYYIGDGKVKDHAHEVEADLGEYYTLNEDILKSKYGFASKEDFIAGFNGEKPGYEKGEVLDATFSQVFGQGILDVGKAVDGLAQLNANRLSVKDIDGTHGLLYAVSFDDQVSFFNNDISQKLWVEAHHMVGDAISEENRKVSETMMKQTTVGFLKDGSGLLFMRGKNTYEGDTVIRGGALSVSLRPDGMGGELTASDVYVECSGFDFRMNRI